ncbi:hypothetical protein F4555_001519 [Mobiluncus mulieris]|nr:hypothetical protein [Mobiluncus mulieris]
MKYLNVSPYDNRRKKIIALAKAKHTTPNEVVRDLIDAI